jgi:iron complex outermembrane receptor protein
LLRDAIRRALFVGAIAAVALPLHAQEVADATGDESAAAAAPATLDRITVTGSRISRAVDVETVQPVTVLTRQDMERSGVQSVADVLQNLVVMGSPAISRADALSSAKRGRLVTSTSATSAPRARWCWSMDSAWA